MSAFFMSKISIVCQTPEQNQKFLQICVKIFNCLSKSAKKRLTFEKFDSGEPRFRHFDEFLTDIRNN